MLSMKEKRPTPPAFRPSLAPLISRTLSSLWFSQLRSDKPARVMD
jgi:hypothetical protein